MNKLIPKSHWCKSPAQIPDSLKAERAKYRNAGQVNVALLERARQAYISQRSLRYHYQRNYQYVFADQWGEYVKDEHGHYVTERMRIAKRTGGVVLQNNHLIKVFNALSGVYCKSATMPVCFARVPHADEKSEMMTNALQTNWDNNKMPTVMRQRFSDLCLGGAAIIREEWDTRKGKKDAHSYTVNINKWFVETQCDDPRNWDVSLIGEIRDYTLGELAARLVHSPLDYAQLEQIYAPYMDMWLTRREQFKKQGMTDEESWYWPAQQNLCRTYHIWTLEHRPRLQCYDPMDMEQPLYIIELNQKHIVDQKNADRMSQFVQMFYKQFIGQGMTPEQATAEAAVMAEQECPLIICDRNIDERTGYFIDQVWHFRMLDPSGRVLEEYDSPFEHRDHPYSYKLYNHVNGTVIPFFNCIIDQQRYINRLITIQDMMMMSSIKGLKMVPKSVLGGLSEKEFAKKAVEIGGWIFYDDSQNTGAKPEVITQNAQIVGMADLLQLELSFISEISSVSQALQGQRAQSGTSAQRYALETENSTTSIAPLLVAMNEFENDVATKKMQIIHQYYTEPRNISARHASRYSEYSEYDPKVVEDIEFECVIKQAPDSVVNRIATNATLEQLAGMGLLTAQQMLEHGYYPGLEQLKQELRTMQEQAANNQQMMEQGAMPQGDVNIPQIPANIMQQLPQANHTVVNNMRRALSA